MLTVFQSSSGRENQSVRDNHSVRDHQSVQSGRDHHFDVYVKLGYAYYCFLFVCNRLVDWHLFQTVAQQHYKGNFI